MLAVAPRFLYPHSVFPAREAVSLLLGQWLTGQPPTHSSTMVGTTSRARSILSTFDGKRLPAVAFNHDPVRAPSVDRAELHFLNLIARFDLLDHLCQCPLFPFLFSFVDLLTNDEGCLCPGAQNAEYSTPR